jgi:hypothetical protein
VVVVVAVVVVPTTRVHAAHQQGDKQNLQQLGEKRQTPKHERAKTTGTTTSNTSRNHSLGLPASVFFFLQPFVSSSASAGPTSTSSSPQHGQLIERSPGSWFLTTSPNVHAEKKREA